MPAADWKGSDASWVTCMDVTGYISLVNQAYDIFTELFKIDKTAYRGQSNPAKRFMDNGEFISD